MCAKILSQNAKISGQASKRRIGENSLIHLLIHVHKFTEHLCARHCPRHRGDCKDQSRHRSSPNHHPYRADTLVRNVDILNKMNKTVCQIVVGAEERKMKQEQIWAGLAL